MRALLTSLLFWLAGIIQAQDLIIMRNGDEVEAKVEEINPSEVKYKRFDHLDGPLITIYKSDVFMIKYQTGLKEVFMETKSEEPLVQQEPRYEFRPVVQTPQDMYVRGRQDARIHYRADGAFWGTFGAMIYPPAGLITGVIVSATPPKNERFIIKDTELRQNRDYMQGYRKQAHNMKVGKVAAGAGLGLAAWILISAVITSSL